ncbi:MAG: MFS transporter, partial [Acidimicrobiia bacterium]|nr:MFS transporter [Acidimicrobiia bacterium]
MGRWGVRPPLLVACSLVSIGGLVAATASGLVQFLLGQAALGLAAGVFFAPGISSAGALGGTARRGLTMGIFGVAFSIGLAVAALLTAASSRLGWQSAFVAVAALGAAAGIALAATALPSAGPAG